VKHFDNMDEAKFAKLMIIGVVVVVVLFFVCSIGISWYDASVQADVWRRQGSDLSTWEVWRGAKPIDRTLIEHKDK